MPIFAPDDKEELELLAGADEEDNGATPVPSPAGTPEVPTVADATAAAPGGNSGAEAGVN